MRKPDFFSSREDFLEICTQMVSVHREEEVSPQRHRGHREYEEKSANLSCFKINSSGEAPPEKHHSFMFFRKKAIAGLQTTPAAPRVFLRVARCFSAGCDAYVTPVFRNGLNWTANFKAPDYNQKGSCRSSSSVEPEPV